MGTNHIMIPARFLVTIGHLVAMVMVHSTKKINIYNSLGVASSYSEYTAYVEEHGNYPHGAVFPLEPEEKDALRDIDVLLAVAFTCFAIEIASMLCGFTLFFSKINLINIVIHFIAGVFTSWYITFGWKWESLWTIVVLGNFITTLIELIMIVAIFGIKIVVF